MEIWRMPSPLTAASVEARLRQPPSPVMVAAAGKLRSGPSADARLLALLARQARSGVPLRTAWDYYVQGAPSDSFGWSQVLNSPSLHLLAHYASTVTDYSGADVTGAVREAQMLRRGASGKVTTYGGQTAFIDSNAVLEGGRSSTIFGATTADVIGSKLIAAASRRGTGKKSRVTTNLVTYMAEAIENVREHATTGPDGGRDGLCLLQVKRIGSSQVPALLRGLPEAASLASYLDGLAARFGGRLTGLLELTVADTGGGIARTLSRDPEIGDQPPEAELAVLIRAFERSVSSKPKTGAGQGLANMLEDVESEAGAVQVRTGRFSLFRASVRRDGTDRPTSPDGSFWEASRLPDAFGTSLTLLVPTTA
jgi:hypothetical protein